MINDHQWWLMMVTEDTVIDMVTDSLMVGTDGS